MRQILHVPVVHAPEDLGSLAPAVQSAHASLKGARSLRRHTDRVRRFWDEVGERLRAWPFPEGATVRLYQDALPVCGIEERIVADLADQGSANHALLLELTARRGAVLMGTESPELLVREVELLKASRPGRRPRPGLPSPDEVERQVRALMKERDAFIADRIEKTLGPGEVGVLFMGLLHRVIDCLSDDIHVESLVKLNEDPHGATGGDA